MKSVIIALQMAGEPGRRKLSGVLDYVLEKKCQWNIRFVRNREDVSPDFVRRLSAHPVDGVLFSFDNVHAVETELAKIAIPTIVLDLYGSSPIFKRTKNISFVPDVHHRTWGRLRGHAFIDRIGKHGFRVAVYRRPRGTSYDLAELAGWLKSLPKPCGVFAAFDDHALDVLEACRVAGLAVPDDVAVVGVDNDTLLCEHTIPALTSVQPDHAAVGRRAAEMLCEMMEAHNTKHVRRETCAGADHRKGNHAVRVERRTPRAEGRRLHPRERGRQRRGVRLQRHGDPSLKGKDGYGCMQVHNAKSGATVFAYNRFADDRVSDLGIGSNKGNEHTDWTFMNNAGEYRSRRLTILVK